MRALILMFVIITFLGCNSKNEKDTKRSHPSHKYTFVDIAKEKLRYFESDYLPVYSDIYYRDGTNRALLTATISIRNISFSDSAYVLSAVYYDSYGKQLKQYANSTILLCPLESIEFVVEEKEVEGGVGANFIIDWGASNYSDQLLIQSIMIGTYGQQGVSFLSGAKVIKSTRE